ncbi:MAG TPA: L-rhamnose mutarotase [Acidimicrobiia bacterium]|nr:L-rhamnose mutarotase [Acidimicrobiia bacterium]
MRRACFVLEIRSGAEETYDRLHAEIADDVRGAIGDAGLRNYSLFRSGTTVVGYVEAEPDFATSMALLEESSPFQSWAKGFKEVFTETRKGVARLTELEEIWHVD